MKEAEVGIIGGTGLGDALREEAAGEAITLDTPYGRPSCEIILAAWEGKDVAFLSRHGTGHTLSPAGVPYKANIWALKKLGVSCILASGATGSLREEIEPGHLVVCDQVIDRTHGRAGTFFEGSPAVHVEFAEPFCPRLRQALIEAGKRIATIVHPSGTYVCMEGPQFSSRAESRMHRMTGADVVGMTCMPEAKLAREAEICYALVALPTDYDCWRPAVAARQGEALLEEIRANLKRATDGCVHLIKETLKVLGEQSSVCRCQDALRLAIWTDRSRIDPAIARRLNLLLGRYLGESR